MRSVKILVSAGLFVTLSIMGCTKDGARSVADSSGSGTGGSLARFTIAANHLYLADYNTIEVYDLGRCG